MRTSSTCGRAGAERRMTGSGRLFHDFRPAWKRVLARLRAEGKLTDFRFHDFRRSYTSYRLAAGI